MKATADTRDDPGERRRRLASHGSGVLAAALAVKLVFFHMACIFPAAPTFSAGAMGLVTDVCIVLAACSLVLLVRRGWVRFGVFAAANALLTVLVYANVVHFRFYGDVIGIYKFGMAGMVDDAASAVRPLLSWADPLFFVDWAAVGLWAGLGAPRLPGASIASRFRERLSRSPRAFPLGVAGGSLAVAVLVQALWRPVSVPEPFSTAEVMSRSSMLTYYASGTVRAVVGAGPGGERVELLDEVCTCGADALAAGGPALEARAAVGGGTRPSFLLIQVESLNPEAFVPAVMPNLCALAGRGVRLTNFHSFAFLSLTFRGEYSVMTSLYPPPGERLTYPVAGSIREGGLIDELKRAGYETWFFHGYNGAFYRRRANYLSWGVDRFHGQEELAELGLEAGCGFGRGPHGPGIDDEDMSRAVPEILAGARRPYFALYVTLSSHFPYTLPEGEDDGGEEARTFDAAYVRIMRYVDRELGVLLDGLGSRGLLEDAYVIVYSDHRGRFEEFARYHDELGSASRGREDGMARTTRPGRDNGMARTTRPGRDNGMARTTRPGRIAAFVERHRVPCLIAGPGIAPARSEMRSSHVDIGPTVLELAGIGVPGRMMMGRSLMSRRAQRLTPGRSRRGLQKSAEPTVRRSRSYLRDCSCRVWALPTLTGGAVLAGPGTLGLYSKATGRLDLYDADTGEPRELSDGELTPYRAVISRLLYSEWVFMRRGRR